jgi:hypothetical protein
MQKIIETTDLTSSFLLNGESNIIGEYIQVPEKALHGEEIAIFEEMQVYVLTYAGNIGFKFS